MTVEQESFTIDGAVMSDIRTGMRSRVLALDAYLRSDLLTQDEASALKVLSDKKQIEQTNKVVLASPELYATKFITLLSRKPKDDIVTYVLVIIIDVILQDKSFANSILQLSKIDSTLPYTPLIELLSSEDESIILSSIYVLSLLFLNDPASINGNSSSTEDNLVKLFDILCNKLLKSTSQPLNYLSIQFIKELLTIKSYRLIFWKNHLKLSPNLFKTFMERKGELQMRYYSTFSIWLLTFSKQTSKDISDSYPELIGALYVSAKDSVKEKIVRLSISSLLNILNVENNEKIVKQSLLVNGLEISKNLLERKWADEELKLDLETLVNLLTDAVSTLTTFDEFENELKLKKFTWSPSHKSEEFWIENIEKFKENNWKLLKELVSLITFESVSEEQMYLNQSIICHDIYQIIKNEPDVVKILDKSGAKPKIMSLLNSPNSNVKFEALKTTQKLLAFSI